MSRNGFPPLRAVEASLVSASMRSSRSATTLEAAPAQPESPAEIAPAIAVTLEEVGRLCREAMRLQNETPIGGGVSRLPVKQAWLNCDNACRRLIETSEQQEATRVQLKEFLESLGVSPQRASLMVW